VSNELPSVLAARAEVEAARKRMLGTLAELQRQFAPHALVREAWESARDKGAELAEDAVDAVKARPLAATGVVAAIAMFLAREPLIDLASKLVDGVNQKRTARKRPKATPSKVEGAKRKVEEKKDTEATQ
jgi:hypothetical protein